MSKTRIRWIAGLSLAVVALTCGGAYFVQVWRKVANKAAETAKAKEKEKTPDAKKDGAVKPIPVTDEPGEDEPPTELGSFSKTRFPKRDQGSGSPSTGGSEFDTAAQSPPSGGFDEGLGDDEEQPAPPAAFGGGTGAASNITSGGGFDEAGESSLAPLRAPGGRARLNDAALEFPAEGNTDLEPQAPNTLTDAPPAARFAEVSEAPQPAVKRPPSAFRSDAARPAPPPSEDISLDSSPPSSRMAFDDRAVKGVAGSRIDGPHADGQGAPGPRALEGLQAPSLAMEKAVPNEIQVGKPATFQIKVRNVGQSEAHEVVVYDEVPKGTRFVDATPQAGRSPEGSLTWQLGTLRPGEEQTISLQLMPTAEGEIGSVARVSFQAQASARTISTRPQLKIEHTAPPKVLIGQGVTFAIKISNPGTGAATNVVLEEDVPDGLSHPGGNELEFEVGTLRPGESKELELTLKAEKPGLVTNVILVRGDAGLSAEDRVEVEVIAPQLQVEMKGPSRRYLDRQATYVFSVANNGTAPAREVELVAFLPKGFKFVETNNAGQYDPQKHAVLWSLAELPASESGAVQLVALPIEAGEQKIRVEGRADLGLADAQEQAVLVESVAQILFDVIDTSDPIEVGSDTSYQVRIVNQGTKAATNVRVIAALPAELQPLGGEGPSKAVVEGQRVQFEPLARLAPKSEALYRISVRGVKAGDPRIRVQVAGDEIQAPVTKEEATKVYADQ